MRARIPDLVQIHPAGGGCGLPLRRDGGAVPAERRHSRRLCDAGQRGGGCRCPGEVPCLDTTVDEAAGAPPSGLSPASCHALSPPPTSQELLEPEEAETAVEAEEHEYEYEREEEEEEEEDGEGEEEGGGDTDDDGGGDDDGDDDGGE